MNVLLLLVCVGIYCLVIWLALASSLFIGSTDLLPVVS